MAGTYFNMLGVASVLGGAVLVLEATLLAGVAAWSVRHLRRKQKAARELKPHFLRLGRLGPTDACDCGRGKAGGTLYADCCREKDIERLKSDIIAFNWKVWSQRSYAGRRWSRSMKSRLEEFPIPEVVLPKWVTSPEKFVFPVDEQVVRAWRPHLEGPTPDTLDGGDIGLGF